MGNARARLRQARGGGWFADADADAMSDVAPGDCKVIARGARRIFCPQRRRVRRESR